LTLIYAPLLQDVAHAFHSSLLEVRQYEPVHVQGATGDFHDSKGRARIPVQTGADILFSVHHRLPQTWLARSKGGRTLWLVLPARRG
jgi:hypothetical protein